MCFSDRARSALQCFCSARCPHTRSEDFIAATGEVDSEQQKKSILIHMYNAKKKIPETHTTEPHS